MPLDKNEVSRCFGHPDCPMTAGYHIGGGYYICWLHILRVPGGFHYYRERPVIMPTAEQQRELHFTTGAPNERNNHICSSNRSGPSAVVVSEKR